MELRALSITEISTYVTQIFDAEELLQDIQIYGEISGFSVVRGNAYFSLKDNNAILSCICFGIEDKNISVKNGDQVLLTGSVKYYAKGGKLNFYTTNITPYGLGAIYQQFLILKDKLSNEGLFDLSHKKPLPKIIKTIGVVTSSTGAVIQDIINVSTRRNPSINIVLYPAKVQGAGSEKTIIDGIKYLDKSDVDVIIVARGGGSYEDLQPFNNEELARVVYECNKPLISAVGHETDFTIIDFVSDLRAPTPSAAAELVTVDILNEYKKVKKDALRLVMAFENVVLSKLNGVVYNCNSISSAIENNLVSKKSDLMLFANKLNMLSDKPYKDPVNKINLGLNSLNNLNPTKILMKGYSQVYFNDKIVSSKKEIKVNDDVEIAFIDGKVKSKIISIDEV